ncbi:MAG: DMT family transporter [Holosporaceae bacterium]|jgi:S-adenosylmethionine uptake transporter|nr:DMT family transporter [Holosporaceae bacterium]
MNNKKCGYLLFICGVCLYSLSDAIMKYFMSFYGVNQIVFWRTIFRFFPFLFLIFYTRTNPLKTDRPRENILRAFLASGGTYAFMYAYKYSAMTDVFVIGLTTAIFVIPLSVWILKEKFYRQNVFVIFLGFFGICLAMRPGSGELNPGILFALVGAVISALNQVIVKKLSATENELTIISYHNILLILISSLGGMTAFAPAAPEHIAFLFVGGVVGAVAQYLIIHSFKLSSSSGLASAGYVMLIPNTLFDFFLYNKIPDVYIIAGLLLIMIGTFRAFTLQSKM